MPHAGAQTGPTLAEVGGADVAGAASQRPQLTRSELREVLTTALRAGQILLENGANTSRIEETVHRLGTALGAEWMDIAVTPHAIMASAISGDEHRTIILRTTGSGVDLSRVADVLAISRAAALAPPDIPAVRAALDRVAIQPRRYGTLLTMAAVGGACACITTLFGGGWLEFGVVLVCAALAQLLRQKLMVGGLNRLLTTAIVAASSSALALLTMDALAPLLRMAVNPSLVVIGAVVLLVPGVPLVSSIADLFRGDTLAGLARLVSAALVVAMISVGIWATLLLLRTEVPLQLSDPPPLLLAVPLAGLVACGFGVLFDVPLRALLFAALTGALAYAVRLSVIRTGAPLEVAAAVGGLTIGLVAEVLARRLQLPTTLFVIPAFIPLVPGVIAFRAVLGLVRQDYAAGLSDLVRAALVITAIAIGLGVVAAITRTRQPTLFGR